MNLIHLPIEQYPNRYTAEWCQQFESAFTAEEVSFSSIIPEQEVTQIKQGSVLDACGTNLYKLAQLDRLLRLIHTGQVTEDTVIFFADLWFPGIESLFYIRNITGINFKIAGILHAGSWDPFDFTSRTGMRNWAQHVELGWLNAVDLIFVATQWHKDLIVMNSGTFDEDKIFVTGLPFYPGKAIAMSRIDPRDVKKEDLIVFPHRLDEEKHPEKFDRLAKKYPQWMFAKTLTVTNSREDYFKMLARAKVMISYAEQETFGYSTLEAMALGCHVIVPDALSYRETVPASNRYKNEREISGMLETFMQMPELPHYPNLHSWESSISKMIRVIKVNLKEASKKRAELEEKERQEQIRIEEERKAKKKLQEEMKDAN